jgi:nitrilase
MTKVAVIQKPPSLLNRELTIASALHSVEEAVAQGAKLLVFPEAFIPGYPTWIWRLKPGGDMALSGEIHAQLRSNAVDLRKDHLDPLCDVAARHGVIISIGFHEIDGEFSGNTLFNSVALIGADGKILNRHRKLMPTNPERMVWGMGDASGLRVVDTEAGRVGVLICWENYMPLARYALYAQNMEILIAPTWDCGDGWTASMRHIAKEGGCWVISSATAIESADLPDDFPERERLYAPDEWINPGDAIVVHPSGAVAAGPLHREKGILYAVLDVEAARRARRSLDVCGHYSRPDIFSLSVDRRVMRPVDFKD